MKQKVFSIGDVSFTVTAESPEEAEHQVVHFLRAAYREYAHLYGIIDYEWSDDE